MSESIGDESIYLRMHELSLGMLQFTDSTNAYRLLKEHGKDIRYNMPWKKWLVWNGCQWELDKDYLIHDRGLKMVRSIYAELLKTSDYRDRLDIEKHAVQSESARRRKAGITKKSHELALSLAISLLVTLLYHIVYILRALPVRLTAARSGVEDPNVKILLTGAFGNIGFSTLQELLKQGHIVRSFDLKNKQTQKKARQVAGKTEIIWGDIRDARQVANLVVGQDAIVHIAAILPPDVDERPEEAVAVNVEGTRFLLEEARKQPQPPKFLFSSSLDVFGYTQDRPPPRKLTDPVVATDAYTTHKLQDEEMIKSSGLTWSIYRFADVPPLAPRKAHPIMYRIPLNTRFDMLHTTDAALAIANGLAHDEIWGRVWLIGGGPSCQVYYRDYLEGIMGAMGVGKLPEDAFGHDPYCTDWLDSEESEQLLHYQRHSFDEIIAELVQYVMPGGPTKLLMPIVRPFVRRWLLKMSPYLKSPKPAP